MDQTITDPFKPATADSGGIVDPFAGSTTPAPASASNPAPATGVTGFLKRQLGGQGEQPYGSGIGYLVDNPLTRGLGGAANELATGASELAQRGVGVVSPTAASWLKRNVTQPLAERQADFEAPKDAGVGSDVVQSISNLGGQLAFAGLAGGGGLAAEAPEAATGLAKLAPKLAPYLKPAALRAAGVLGFGNAAAQAAQQEAQTGTPESTAKLLGTGAAMTAGNLIPLGGTGGVLTRAIKGAATSEGINEGLNLINGQPLGTGALMATGLGAGFGLLPHPEGSVLQRPEPLPGAAPGTLSDAANTLHRSAPPAAAPQAGANPAGAEAAAAKPADLTNVRGTVPPAPWVNTDTGEVTTPSPTQVLAQMHGLLDQKAAQAQNGNNLMFAPRAVADTWGLPLERVQSLLKVAANERRAGMTTEQAMQRANQTASGSEIPNNSTAAASPDTGAVSAAGTADVSNTPGVSATAQPDLLTNPNVAVSDRQKARIAQRIRGGGVSPGLLDAAAEEATAGQAQDAPARSQSNGPNTSPEPAPPSLNAHLEPQTETPPQGGVSASEPTQEEAPDAQVQSPATASDERGGDAGAGEPNPESQGPAAAAAAGHGSDTEGAAGAGRPDAAAVPAAPDTAGLENALSKTDRATGPDGATYLVKQNANGEGYHFNRMEDGSSTQHRNTDPAQPWSREDAISAAAQMAKERTVPASAEPASAAGDAATAAPKPSEPESAQAGQAAAEGQVSPASEAPKAPNVAETTPKTPETQAAAASSTAAHAAAWEAVKAKDPQSVPPAPKPERVVTDQRVPLAAGLSQDGKTLYIDKAIPQHVDVNGVKVDAWDSIEAHERIEHPQMQQRGKPYAAAHDENANTYEDAYLRAKYGDKVTRPALDKALKPYIEQARAEAAHSPDIPADLDRNPYKGSEHLLEPKAGAEPALHTAARVGNKHPNVAEAPVLPRLERAQRVARENRNWGDGLAEMLEGRFADARPVLSILKDAARDQPAAEKAKLTRLIKAHTHTDKDGAVYADRGLLDHASEFFAYSNSDVHDAIDRAVENARGTHAAGDAGAAQPEAVMQNRDRGRAASVAQMQQIANHPDPMRLGFSRDANTGAPMVSAKAAEQAVPKADQGDADAVVMGNGRQIPVRYAVVEAPDVAASHNADGTVNKDYGKAALRALNNGRTAGIQAAWRKGTAADYKAGLLREAKRVGIDPAAIESKRQPMLIRLYDESHNQGDMGAESNASAGTGLSPAEQARTDARAIGDLADIPVTESGALSTNPSHPFYRNFMQAIGHNEAAKLVDAEGRPNKVFMDRVQAAIFAKAYGDDRLIAAMAEEANPDAKNVLNALTLAAPKVARIERTGPLGDFGAQMAAAIETMKRARESGQSVESYLAQGSLLARNTDGDRMAAFFARNTRSAARMAEAVRAMAERIEIVQQGAKSGDMFGGEKPTVEQIVDAVISDTEQRHAQGTPKPSSSLFNAAGRATREAVGRPAEDGREGGQRASGQQSETGAPGSGTHEEADGGRVEEAPLGASKTSYGTTSRIQRRGVSEPGQKAGRGSAAGVSGTLDLFAAAGKGSEPAQVRAAAPRLLQNAKIVKTGVFRSGIERIGNWQDAAHIIAPLRKSPQEQMLAIVADADGKPIAVLRHTIGQNDHSSVKPGTVFGAVAQIPGAKRVWFAHNHPSGRVDQSLADRSITSELHRLMNGSGVIPEGMIVVAPGSKTATFYHPDDHEAGRSSGAAPGQPITPARRSSEVPQVERAFRKIPSGERVALTSPSALTKAVKEVARDETGVMLLDGAHRVLGFIPMSDADMGRLRTRDASTGSARVAAALTEANASAAIPVTRNLESGQNIGKMLKDADVRVLDIATLGEGGEISSATQAGRQLFSDKGFFSKPESGAGEEPRHKLSDFMRGPAVAEAGNDALPPQPGERAGIGEITRRVVGYFRSKKINAAESPQIGRVLITPNGIRASLEHGYGREKIAAFTLLPDVIEKGRLVSEQNAYDGTTHDRLLIGAPVRVLGKDYLMGVMVKRDANGQKTFYLHEVTLTPANEERRLSPKGGSAAEVTQPAGQTGVVESLLRDAHAGKRDDAFSRPMPGAQGGGLPHEQVQALVSDTRARWGENAPNIHVRETPADFPVSARNTPGFDMGNHAYYDGRDIYLARSNLRTPQDVLMAMAHEPVHYALDRIMDEHVPGGWKKFTAAVERLRQDPALGSKEMRAAINETERRYKNADGSPADAETFARELPAVMAERGVKNGILARVVQAIRAFLKRVMPGVNPTEKMLHDLLRQSDKYLQGGERYSDRVARMQAMAFSHQPDPFYSALSESVGRAKGAPKSADAAAWKQWLDGAQRRGEFKGSEREWLGLDQWLDQHKGPVTRAELNDYVRENQVRVQEVMHGDEPPSNAADINENEDGSFDLTDEGGALANTPDRPTRYSSYQLPGGQNYRELLLTLPRKLTSNELYDQHNAFMHAMHDKYGDGWRNKASAADLAEDRRLSRAADSADGFQQNYTSGHFDTPNILAHVRMNDRTGPDGERILHVEEVQSDWHQAGRKQGYRNESVHPAARQRIAEIQNEIRRLSKEYGDSESGVRAFNERVQPLMLEKRRLQMALANGDFGVPDAPFKKEWPMLAMKRVLRYAAEHGYDKVTWTTGEQQAARYDLSKNVHSVSYSDKNQLTVYGHDTDSPLLKETVPPEKLGDYIGKEPAERLLASRADEYGFKYLSDDGLKLGGEGMHAFYDKMLPNELNKYAKQWGAKVGKSAITTKVIHDSFGEGADFEIPVRATVHSVDITPAMRESVLKGQPLFSRPAQATMDDLDKVMAEPDAERSAFEKVKAWLGGKGEDLRPAALGWLQTRHVLELMEHVEPLKGYGKEYGRSMQQLDTDRSHLLIGEPELPDHPRDPKNMLAKGAVPIAQALRDYAYQKGPAGWLGRRTQAGKDLFDLMHQATINGMDPDKEYERLTIENAHGDAIPWTKEAVSQRLKLLRELALQRGGDPVMREKITDEKKYLRNIAKMERSREQRWPELVKQWHALPDQAKDLYRQTRDWYAQHRDAVEQALVKNIEGYDVPETYRRSLINRMRLQFEEARRSGVYFPLNRDGDYWMSFQDKDGNEGFKMFESKAAAASAELKLKRAGFQINASGRRDPNAKAKSAPSGTFVREVIDILKKAGVSEKTQDAIYQSFLQTLPEMSMRKHSIHRRNIAGFSEDGLRAFAKNSFHGAHQLAKLRHLQDMQTQLEAMQQTADAWRKGGDEMSEGQGRSIGDTAKVDALVGELGQRHQWIMNPTDAQLANHANAIGFMWYLGASPASALTNMTQVVQTTLPVLGAQHGWGKATRALGAAWRDAARTGGHMDRTLTDPDERRAFLVMQQRGDFSKTQAHTLAGLAEGNVLQSSPAWTKTMGAVSWMFHTAEVINREAAGMAAFRLARARGDDFNKAIEYAGEINTGTNFDYSAANRPRMMQGNAMRIALQFKQYGVGMSWLFYRNLYQAMKGETPEVRQVARRTVTGILGMTALLAGTTGLPIYNGVKAAANAANLAFGDPDQPFDFDTEFHAWLAEHLGTEAANVIATGPVSELTGADFANRTSMSNLFFQNNDQNLEGADAYHALLESLAGPMGGITKNFYVGAQRIRQGNVQRGIETMLPVAVKNSVKALRYAHDGANTLRGDPILPDISGPQDLIQALGFTPTKLAQQQNTNSAMANFTKEVQDRRQTLLNAFAMAIHAGDPDDRSGVLDQIRAFNQKYPTIAISPKTIHESMRNRARYSARAVNGIAISPKLLPQAQEFAGAEQ